MTVYIDNATHRRLKSALTRALNSGDPVNVLRAVETALAEWDGKAWPDDWHRWQIALDDAERKWNRTPAEHGEDIELILATARRFNAAFETLR
jgi:hypothetical protein